jgi:hypothetical protein
MLMDEQSVEVTGLQPPVTSTAAEAQRQSEVVRRDPAPIMNGAGLADTLNAGDRQGSSTPGPGPCR